MRGRYAAVDGIVLLFTMNASDAENMDLDALMKPPAAYHSKQAYLERNFSFAVVVWLLFYFLFNYFFLFVLFCRKSIYQMFRLTDWISLMSNNASGCSLDNI